ncbi:MAG TPA: hypothetical protein VNZ86_05360, partial [Bacteroidia bacterium]|nr:hypothetical protein [Bacteroidia bacterium]
KEEQKKPVRHRPVSPLLRLTHYRTVTQIPEEEWNALLGYRSNFDWKGLAFYEKGFCNNIRPEDNWEFDYYIIKDQHGSTVLATFVTTTLCKDDMLAPKNVSIHLEKRRRSGEPYLLISKMVSTGSPITAGNHLYLDRSSPYWKEALSMLLNQVEALLEKNDAQSVLLRDLTDLDAEMDLFLIENGYFKIPLPENYVQDQLDWTSEEEYLGLLSRKSRIHVKQEILRHRDKFELEQVLNPTPEETQHMYELYLEINRKSYELNTFPLPFKLVENMTKDGDWEILTLKLKAQHDQRPIRKPVAVAFFYKTDIQYNALLVGMDYTIPEVTHYRAYKQIMYQGILRARDLGLKAVQLGYTAAQVKKMLGAHAVQSVGYMQSKDNYTFEMIE